MFPRILAALDPPPHLQVLKRIRGNIPTEDVQGAAAAAGVLFLHLCTAGLALGTSGPVIPVSKDLKNLCKVGPFKDKATFPAE